MRPIPEISGLDLAFGTTAHLPKYDEIPEEFKKRNNPFVKIQQKWFFSGLDGGEIEAKKGVDRKLALKALAAIQKSFEPSHEHKEAGVAFLMSEWFDLTDTAALASVRGER
jgi:hypothetical protein